MQIFWQTFFLKCFYKYKLLDKLLPLSILTILRQRSIARQKKLHVIPESYQTASVSNDKYLELIMHKQFIPQEFSTLTA